MANYCLTGLRSKLGLAPCFISQSWESPPGSHEILVGKRVFVRRASWTQAPWWWKGSGSCLGRAFLRFLLAHLHVHSSHSIIHSSYAGKRPNVLSSFQHQCQCRWDGHQIESDDVTGFWVHPQLWNIHCQLSDTASLTQCYNSTLY